MAQEAVSYTHLAAGENMIQPHPVLFGIIYGLIGIVIQNDSAVADGLVSGIGKGNGIVILRIESINGLY